jgi:uncharacterized protein (TIGR03437 family)
MVNLRTIFLFFVLSLVAAVSAFSIYHLSLPSDTFHSTASVNDPFSGNQWALKNTGQFSGSVPGVDIGALEAWDHLTANQNAPVIVAVIDTGLDYTHPDLVSRLWKNTQEIPNNRIDDDGNGYPDDVVGWNFVSNSNDPSDNHSHGTMLSGIIAAETNNNLGIAGACGTANVRVMALKAFDTNSGGNTLTAAAAIDYAVRHGARIINLSWGDTVYSDDLFRSVQRAVIAGCLVVTAAGNSSSNNDAVPVYPASFGSGNNALPAVISVAAINEADQLTPQSNYGLQSVSLAAPGNFIYTTRPGSNYGYVGGTSIAAAFVSATAAMVIAKYPSLTSVQVKSILISSVRQTTALNGKTFSGGVVHAARALTAAASQNTVTTVSAADFSSMVLAPDSIASVFGSRLGTATELAQYLPLPSSLAGSTVKINGISAPLFAVTPGQINLLIPSQLAVGPAEIVVTAADGTISRGMVTITNCQPGIFTANQAGSGAPAAAWTRDGLTYFPAGRSDGTTLAMDAGSFLVLACTGLRYAPQTDGNAGNGVAESVQISIGGVSAPVIFAGAQGNFAGLDQVNLKIPESLRGRGQVELTMSVAGRQSNKVLVNIR